MSLDVRFQAAVDIVQKLPKNGLFFLFTDFCLLVLFFNNF